MAISKWKIFATGMGALAVSAVAQAQSIGDGGGTDIGNGGGAWVCLRGSRVQWVELVDHYEARTELRLNVPAAVETDYEQILNRLSAKIQSADAEFYRRYSEKLQFVRSHWNEMPQSDLREFDDLLWTSRPADTTCRRGVIEYRQIVNFRDDNRVQVDVRWFTELSPLDKAMLQMHEAIYAMKRMPVAEGGENAQDSRTTRELVGYLASDAPVGEYRHLLRISVPVPPPARPLLVPGVYESTEAVLRHPLYRSHRSRHVIFVVSPISAERYSWRPLIVDGSAPEAFQHIVAICRSLRNGRVFCSLVYDGSLRFGSTLLGSLEVDPANPTEMAFVGNERGDECINAMIDDPRRNENDACLVKHYVFGGRHMFFRRMDFGSIE